MKYSKHWFGRVAMMAVAAMCLFVTLPEQTMATDEVPTHKFLIHCGIPKGALRVTMPGEVRTFYEGYVEGWWREESYWLANQTNGVREWGVYHDTKTYGDNELPWWGFAPVRPDAWGAGSLEGEPNREDLPGPEAHPGQRHGGGGAMVDGFWTPGERFFDRNSNGEWGDLIYGELHWHCSIPDILTNPYMWQVSSGTYTSMFLNSPGYRDDLINLHSTMTSQFSWDNHRGEMFADYSNVGISNQVAYNSEAFIWVTDPNGLEGSNTLLRINELDLTPDRYSTNWLEGDLEHIFEDGDVAGPGVTNDDPALIDTNYDIPRNGTLDYVQGMNGALWAQAYRGSDTGDLVYVTFHAWVYEPWYPETLQFYGPGIGTYDGTNAVAENLDAGETLWKIREISVPVYQCSELMGWWAGYSGDARMYRENSGGNFDHAANPVQWPWPPRAPRFRDHVAIVNDEWDPGIAPEPFEDFISWWVPHPTDPELSYWTKGVIGLPARFMPNANPNTLAGVISAAEYVAYVQNNYPGSTGALIARYGNQFYDGPDDWIDSFPSENKYQWSGQEESPVVPDLPLTTAPMGWVGNWQTWWQRNYSTYASTPPNWLVPVPAVTPFECDSSVPAAMVPEMRTIWIGNTQEVTFAVTTTNAVSGQIITNMLSSGGGWIPRLNNTWGYDSPQEFDNLASSIYHYSGDKRLGEITSPYTPDIWGDDRGDDNPWTANAGPPDGFLPAAGPWAYEIHGTLGHDAGCLLGLEVMTWRRDGSSPTGPRGLHFGSGEDPVPDGNDHRDVNLDGLIDQGKTIPPDSFSYFIDDIEITPDGGRPDTNGSYPFDWNRYIQDNMEIEDCVENWNTMRANYVSGTLDAALRFVDDLRDQDPGVAIGNVVGHANGFPHTGYMPGDSVWIDADGSGTFGQDVALNAISGSITQNTFGVTVAGCRYYEANGNLQFDAGGDNAWVDDGDGIFETTDDLLAESGTLELMNGAVGRALNAAGTTARVVYRDNDGSTSYTYGDDVWMEDRGLNPGTPYVLDTNDIRIISSPALTNGSLAAFGIDLPNVYYIARDGRPIDTGYVFGDDLWSGDGDGIFECEEILVHNNLMVFPWLSPLAMVAGNVGNVLADVAYRENGGNASYQQAEDDAWWNICQANEPAIRFNQETILSDGIEGSLPVLEPGLIADYPIPGVLYHDENGNASYDPGIEPYFIGSNPQPGIPGDPVWVDGNVNGLFDAARRANIPQYAIGYHEGIPNTPGGPSHAGYYVPRTMDTTSGYGGFVRTVSIYNIAHITHEQGHEIIGWKDYYDYDVWDPPTIMNNPISGFDLMAQGGLVHGIGHTKMAAGFIRPVGIQGTIVPQGMGPVTLRLWPVERNVHQYYYFMNDDGVSSENFVLWYQSGASIYSGPGSQGVHLEHDSSGMVGGVPHQQRHNYYAEHVIVQADGLYELEDAVNSGTPADVYPGTTGNRVISGDTIPWTRWWTQRDSGLRITDIRLPDNTWSPAEVDVEWFDVDLPWKWPEGGADTDNDGIPDVWEYHWMVQSLTPLEEMDETTDWDMDGLSDLAEYLSHSDPTDDFSLANDDDGLPDPAFDIDGDQISNFDEFNKTGTNPYDPDTDDDGYSDGDEVFINVVCGLAGNERKFTSPNHSMSPLTQRSMVMDGTGVEVPPVETPLASRFELTAWTIECWVYLTSANETGDLIVRPTSTFKTNFMLHVDNNIPSVGFSTEGGHVYNVSAPGPIAQNTWVHLAGMWDPEMDIMKLYIDGALASQGAIDDIEGCAIGQISVWDGGTPSGRVYLGRGVNGYLDEVRIWGVAKSASEIAFGRNYVVNTPWDDGIRTVPVPGGTNTVTGEAQGNLAPAVTLYNGAFDNSPVVASTVTIQAGPYTFTDDGNGMLAGTLSNQTGTVNYNTGIYALELTAGAIFNPADSMTADYQYLTAPTSTSTFVALTNSVQSVGLVANFRFDDGQNETHLLPDVGTMPQYGAEDFVHHNDNLYAIWGATFDSTIFANLAGSPDYTEPMDDLDEDGIPDWWQELFWPGPENPYVTGLGEWSPEEDPDGDGALNLQEYNDDTNPHDSNDFIPPQTNVLRILDIRWNDIDVNGVYSDGDVVIIIFTLAVDNAAGKSISEMVLVGDPAATWGTGAVMSPSPGGTIFSIVVGSSPVLNDTIGVDPANTVTTISAIPDSTSPAFPLPAFAEVDDEDGDGLLDSWETDMGLSTTSGIGDDGPYGDPDHDGLINLYEYMAFLNFGVRLNPKIFDTYATDGPILAGDYFGTPWANELMYGEMYDDTDQLPDWWEVQYSGDLGTFEYHWLKDPDLDLWNNGAEYMYFGTITDTNGLPVLVRSTDPTDPGSYPAPFISGILRYDGVSDGDYHVVAFNKEAMDREPVAVGDVVQVGRVWQFTITNLTAGSVYLFAWKGDDPFDVGDPSGMPYNMPLDMSWGSVQDAVIGLTDAADEPWYPHFSWTAPGDATDYFVRLYNSSHQQIMTKWIKATRAVFRKIDYQLGTWTVEDYSNGLPPDNYSWSVAYNEVGGVDAIFETGGFSVLPYVPSQPTLVSPVGGTIVRNARYDLQWTAAAIAPQFSVTVGPIDDSWVWTRTIAAPWRDDDGLYVYAMPDLLGSGIWTNGSYKWTVTAQNRVNDGSIVSSAASADGYFEIGVTVPPPDGEGSPALRGNVYYYGRLPQSNIVVNAYKTPSFSGVPQGQALVNGATGFTIMGLYNNLYYVKAFMDVNGNGVEDYWEPRGIARDVTYGTPNHEFWTDYTVATYDLSALFAVRNIRIVIIDRDTDGDNMPDAWEWSNLVDMFGNPTLNRSGSADLDSDGLSNQDEYRWGTDPQNWDTDGDTVSDGDEVWVFGTDPVGTDSDGDGLTDDDENNVYFTNPLVRDTDGDGIEDGLEVSLGLNPAVSNSDAVGVPANVKVGWDGNANDYNPGGTDLSVSTTDTDGDGVSDLEEIAAGSDPLNAASFSNVQIANYWVNGSGEMVIEWSVFANTASVDVTFYVESSASLVSPAWTLIGSYTSSGDIGGPVNITDSATTGPYYRLRFEILAQ